MVRWRRVMDWSGDFQFMQQVQALVANGQKSIVEFNHAAGVVRRVIALHERRHRQEVYAVAFNVRAPVQMPGDTGDDVSVATEHIGDFVMVPQEAVGFVGAFLQEWKMAEEYRCFTLPLRFVELLYQPVDLLLTDRTAVERCPGIAHQQVFP